MKNKYQTILVIPYLGIFVFLLLYVLAAVKYPGGSHTNPYDKGFSLWDNYFCDLLDAYAVNGAMNPARDWARLALLVLCMSLIYSWFHLPKLFSGKRAITTIMRFTGISALTITLFMTADNHDSIVRIAGVFGVVAMLTTFIELFRSKYYKLFGFGIFCLLILIVNYYIYETRVYVEALPVIQKITFITFIGWFMLMDFCLYRRLRSATKI